MRLAIPALLVLTLSACKQDGPSAPAPPDAAVKKDTAQADLAPAQNDSAATSPDLASPADQAQTQPDTAVPDAALPPDTRPAPTPDTASTSIKPDTAGYIGVPNADSWLFIVMDVPDGVSKTLGLGEQALVDHFKAKGVPLAPLTARTFDSSDSNYNPKAVNFVYGRKGVIMSNTLDSGRTPLVVSAFKGLAVPFITFYDKSYSAANTAPWMAAATVMVGTSSKKGSGTSAGTQVLIENAAHPLAAGLSGTVTVSTSGNLTWGIPQSAGAVKIASVVGVTPTSYAVFAFPRGAAMDDGSTAPAARVGIFYDGKVDNGLTADGWKLIDAALDWAETN